MMTPSSSCNLPAAAPAAGSLPAAPDASCYGRHDAFGILHDCHQHILERLTRLLAVAGDVESAGSLQERHLAGLGDVLAFLHTAIPIHSADEEVSLFPRLRTAVAPVGGHTPMDCMEQEHVQHRAQLSRLERAIVRRDAQAVARAARAIVTDYRSHIEREEEVLFPWARELLAQPVMLAEMTAEMRHRRVEVGLLSC